MRILTAVALALTLGIAQPALAQESLLNIYCEDCRNLNDHPEDARNFAVNQVFGSEAWLDLKDSNRFEITDSFLNTVQVDVNLEWVWYVEIPLIDFPIIPIPEKLLLQVRLVYENGNVESYTFDTKDLDANGSLPVPVSGTAPPPLPDPGGDSDDDDFSEDEEENFDDEDELDWGDDEADWGDDSDSDGDCGGCEAYFDGDEDGEIDDDPTDWTDEEGELVEEA